MNMNQKVLAARHVNPQSHSLRLIAMCFLATSLLRVFQIAHAAPPSATATPATTPSASSYTSSVENNKSKEQPSSDKEMQAYTVKRAMSVEELIKEVYAGTPLNQQVLVKALFEANPKVLNGKPAQSIKRNQVLYLPDHVALVTQILTPYSPPPTAASGDAAQYGSQSSDVLSRRLWVRFP
jgi:hypothetical protein